MSDSPGKSKDKPTLALASEDEFVGLIEGIDRELIADNVDVPMRPMEAIGALTKRFDIALPVAPDEPIVPGLFTPAQISARVLHWMTQRYGDRLKVSYVVGRVAFPFRGAVYTLRCPTVLGTVRFVCVPTAFGQFQTAASTGTIPVANIVDYVDGFTADLASSLSETEALQIAAFFVAGMDAFYSLRHIEDVRFIREAIGDLDAAVRHLSEPSQFGLSRWASLQATEKLIKAFIDSAGGTVRPLHRLADLAADATPLGLPALPDASLSAIQCPAGVRYGEVAVSVGEAVEAHLASVDICDFVARSICKVLRRPMPQQMDARIKNVPLRQFLVEYLAGNK